MISLDIGSVLVIAALLVSFAGYVARVSTKLGTLKEQAKNQAADIVELQRNVKDLEKDLKQNYVPNAVLSEIKTQLTDIKKAIERIGR